VPTEVVVVPPRIGPAPVNPVTPLAREVAGATVQDLRRGLSRPTMARDAARLRVETLGDEVAAMERRLAALNADDQQRAARLAVVHDRLRKMAVARYVASPVAPLNDVLGAGDITEMGRRMKMMDTVMRSDQRRVADAAAARRQAGTGVSELMARLDEARAALAAAKAAQAQAEADLAATQARLDGAEAGIMLVVGGFVFPVAGPASFSDTFGAPRMFGTPYAHLHQGTDVFAASGTPLVAAERGVVIRVGVDVLGGNKLWLVGASGARYFYAHLSGFAPGTVDGKVVEAGDPVGYVGNTGNARTTPAHLHFEVHPGGGAAVNPYPLLRIVDDAQRRLAAKPTVGTRTG
jgi:murein DD-endopeptidase MepM/ murein hydrolase activator NlpD